MRKFRMATTLAVVLAGVVPAFSLADAPVFNDSFRFTSDPYSEGWCGMAGTSVDTMVARFRVGSGGSLENLNMTTVFAASASAKSMEVHIARVGKTEASVDNGNGTETFVQTNTGRQSFKLPGGPLLVRSAGTITFAITLEVGTGDFMSFEVVEQHGQFPPGCDFIVEALT
jgi:hypothetical protein